VACFFECGYEPPVFRKMRGISWLAEELLDFSGGLWSMELVNTETWRGD
jgi:hypothetical protein